MNTVTEYEQAIAFKKEEIKNTEKNIHIQLRELYELERDLFKLNGANR